MVKHFLCNLFRSRYHVSVYRIIGPLVSVYHLHVIFQKHCLAYSAFNLHLMACIVPVTVFIICTFFRRCHLQVICQSIYINMYYLYFRGLSRSNLWKTKKQHWANWQYTKWNSINFVLPWWSFTNYGCRLSSEEWCKQIWETPHCS